MVHLCLKLAKIGLEFYKFDGNLRDFLLDKVNHVNVIQDTVLDDFLKKY